jgi:excinuclease ABC subunit C
MELQNKIKQLKPLPGVYLFKDKSGAVIYIGKAIELKKRVSSYFQKDHKDWKTDLLLLEIADFDYILTANENEALLLEAQLIQEHKPKFNVLLKNGNPFLYLLVTSEAIPKLELTRKKGKKGTYFGPFLQKGAARAAYKFLMDTFRLHICNQQIANGCLKFHLHLCAGTCKTELDTTGYLHRIELVKKILNGKELELIELLNKQIKELAALKEYEEAQRLHGYLQNIESIKETIKLHFTPKKFEASIAFALSKKPSEELIDRSIGLKLQELLDLPIAPITVDCFDISHFQSTSIVGSCIRFTHGIPDKSHFKRFKIKTLEQQNDYAALAEIVSRRYRNEKDLPDLVVIDGGKGQLNAVQDLFPHTLFISLAKRLEMVFSKNHPYGILLDQHTAAGKMLIALRDYTHHFAITYHRKKRADSHKKMLEIAEKN